MKIRTKLILSNTAIILIALVIEACLIYFNLIRLTEKNIHEKLEETTRMAYNLVEKSINASIVNYLRATAETNRDITRYYYNQTRAGNISVKSAKKQLEHIFLNQDIGITGYIYCMSSKRIINIHPQKELIGEKSIFFEELKESTKADNEYKEYIFQGKRKALYRVYFKEWDWIISASAYKSEFHTLVNIKDLRKKLLSVKIAETGYIFILDKNASVIIHPHFPGGTNLSNLAAENGKEIFKEIVQKKNGKIAYRFKPPGAEAAKSKIAYYRYIPELDWIVVSSLYEEKVYHIITSIGQIVIINILASFFILILVLGYTGGKITRPIRNLTETINKMSEGNLDIPAQVETNDETGELANSFNMLSGKLKYHRDNLENLIDERTSQLKEAKELTETTNNELTEANNELRNIQEIMNRDMRMAVNIQRAYLPKKPPKTDGWDIALMFCPVAGVSGDLYDFYVSGNRLQGVSIFDVSGHGIASGLISMLAKSIVLRYFTRNEHMRLGELLQKINIDLIKEIGNVSNYVTGILLRFNKNTVEYVNAAHADLLIKKGASGETRALTSEEYGLTGNLLGIELFCGDYKGYTFEIEKEDSLILFTDCLIESRNTDKKEYGIKRLIDSINASPAKASAQELLNSILDGFYGYIDDEEIRDDLTVIILKKQVSSNERQ